jgi:hypothetical protein
VSPRLALIGGDPGGSATRGGEDANQLPCAPDYFATSTLTPPYSILGVTGPGMVYRVAISAGAKGGHWGDKRSDNDGLANRSASPMEPCQLLVACLHQISQIKAMGFLQQFRPLQLNHHSPGLYSYHTNRRDNCNLCSKRRHFAPEDVVSPATHYPYYE